MMMNDDDDDDDNDNDSAIRQRFHAVTLTFDGSLDLERLF